jgi:hypothetical protein
MKKYTSIDEFLKDYDTDPQAYNMMVDVQSIQEVGPYYKPVISMCFMDTSPDGGDIYIQKKPGKDFYGNDYKETRYSITRPGLLKIKSVAKGTFLNPITSYDSEKKANLCITTLQYIGAKEGEWHYTTCSKEVAAVAKSAKGGTYETSEPVRRAESGAQNACIREAFRIKNHYSMEQLQKPFTMVYWVLDETKDDRIFQARIEAGISSTGLLYKRALSSQQQHVALPQAVRSDVDMSTGEIIDANYESEPVQSQPEQTPPQDARQEEKCYCSQDSCRTEIGKAVAEYSLKNFGAQLCTKCQKAAKAAQTAGKQGGR